MFAGLDFLGAEDSLADVRSGRAVLKRGSKGSAVEELQRLVGLTGGDVDGDFGPKTEKAVRAFQGAHDLKVDGQVGKDTIAALEKGPAVTKIDFEEGDTITVSAPSVSVGPKTGPTSTPAADQSNKRNLVIALGLAALGTAGLAFAWTR